MTEEQLAQVQRLVKEYKINSSNLNYMIIILGVNYGVPEETITELIESDKDFIDKHFMLVNKIWKIEFKDRKNEIMDMILKDSELSAAQIEQLKVALEVGISYEDIIMLVKQKREPMEMKKCIEFQLLMKSQMEEKMKEQKKHERMDRIKSIILKPWEKIKRVVKKWRKSK